MFYDNVQFVNVYFDVFVVSKDLIYLYVVWDVFDYFICDMIYFEGGIYLVEDVDSVEIISFIKKKEGLFYIWILQEVSFIVIFMFISYLEFFLLYFCFFCLFDYIFVVVYLILVF